MDISYYFTSQCFYPVSCFNKGFVGFIHRLLSFLLVDFVVCVSARPCSRWIESVSLCLFVCFFYDRKKTTPLSCFVRMQLTNCIAEAPTWIRKRNVSKFPIRLNNFQTNGENALFFRQRFAVLAQWNCSPSSQDVSRYVFQQVIFLRWCKGKSWQALTEP